MPALATSSRLIDVVTDLYDTTTCCPDLEAHAAARNVDPAERKLFEALAKMRQSNPNQSREDALKSKEWRELYKHVAGQLAGAAEKGYGKELIKTSFNTPDHQMLSKLNENLHWFSANKNWQLLVDLNAQLKTSDGKLREWSDFKKEALKLDKQYNTIWLRTEYNAAVASAQMAGRWVDYEEDADDIYVRYDTAGDRRVRPAHALLDGITLPMSDPFWDKYWPPLGFACRCDASEILRTKGKKTNLRQYEKLPEVEPVFSHNSGKTGQVFGDSHPYFQGIPMNEQNILRKIVTQLDKE